MNERQLSVEGVDSAEFLDHRRCYRGYSMPSFPNSSKNGTIYQRGVSLDVLIIIIIQMKLAGDSTGGIVTAVIRNAPIGLGEPCFDKVSNS